MQRWSAREPGHSKVREFSLVNYCEAREGETVAGPKIFLAAERDDVAGLDTRMVVETLDSYSRDRASAMGQLGNVTVTMSGYDDDPRALWEIPPARAWWSMLKEEVPHLLFFLDPQMKGPYVFAFMTCKLLDRGGKKAIDVEEVESFLATGFAEMNRFCKRLGIDPQCQPVTDHCFAVTKSLTG